MASCELSELAFSKIILHSFKYPSVAINGLLLGSKDDSSHSTNMKIVDAVPLFHHNLGLAPMLEVALAQVDNYCHSAKLFVAGYYQANESIQSGPDFVSQKITEKISEHYPNACLVMVNNQQLSKSMKQPAIHVMQLHEGKWKIKDKESLNYLSTSGTLDIVSRLLAEKRYKDLVDFDDHLDDLNQNWLNVELNKVIENHST